MRGRGTLLPGMEVELLPGVSLQAGTWNLLIAPDEVVVPALDRCFASLQHFLILYICGNYSRVLSRIHRQHTHMDIQRSFTAFQLLRILEEAHHSFLFLEYDATLFEEDDRLLDYLPPALADAAQRAMVLLYTPAPDRFIRTLTSSADRVFHLASPEGLVSSGSRRSLRRPSTSQTTLEAF